MRLLYVEDNPDLRTILQKTLTEESYVVETAEDGEEGLHMALLNRYDLIILDLQLPKKDGLQVCREIREAGQQVPILILSVHSDPEAKTNLLNAGADDYLTKPFSFKELTARIHALLRRPHELVKDVLAYADITLDAQRHLVTRNGKDIYLSRKEFILLEYFMRHTEMVLSRQMIAEHVWDTDMDPFSNTIESHILMLRRKIEPNGSIKLLHTIIGRGYMMSTHTPRGSA